MGPVKCGFISGFRIFPIHKQYRLEAVRHLDEQKMRYAICYFIHKIHFGYGSRIRILHIFPPKPCVFFFRPNHHLFWHTFCWVQPNVDWWRFESQVHTWTRSKEASPLGSMERFGPRLPQCLFLQRLLEIITNNRKQNIK